MESAARATTSDLDYGPGRCLCSDTHPCLAGGLQVRLGFHTFMLIFSAFLGRPLAGTFLPCTASMLCEVGASTLHCISLVACCDWCCRARFCFVRSVACWLSYLTMAPHVVARPSFKKIWSLVETRNDLFIPMFVLLAGTLQCPS